MTAVVIALLYYIVAAVFCVGLLWKLYGYTKAPVPTLIPIAPVPLTRVGVITRMAREVLFFESLFRASKWTWLFGWTFHYALAIVLLRHLFFVTDPVPPWIVYLLRPGDYAAWAMLIGLSGLLSRRILVDRLRYISVASDYLMLVLLLLIAVTGLLLRYISHSEIFAIREFALGLIHLSPTDLPRNYVLYFHLSCVALLIAVFPFSKLIHFPAYFFSPSHNQIYTSNTKRQNR